MTYLESLSNQLEAAQEELKTVNRYYHLSIIVNIILAMIVICKW